MALSYGALHGKLPPCQVWLSSRSGGMLFVVKRAGFQMASLKSTITITCITTLLLSAITWFESKQCIMLESLILVKTHLKQKYKKKTLTTFVSLLENREEKKKEKKPKQLQSFSRYMQTQKTSLKQNQQFKMCWNYGGCIAFKN